MKIKIWPLGVPECWASRVWHKHNTKPYYRNGKRVVDRFYMPQAMMTLHWWREDKG